MARIEPVTVEVDVVERQRYPLVLSTFYATPAAILPEKWHEIEGFLRFKARGGQVAEEKVAAIQLARRSDGVYMAGRVAVLPIFGVLAQRVGGLEAASGGISTEAIGARLDNLVADRQVKSIVLQIDSPGGSVYGISELAERILSHRAEKKIVAIADSVAASAAYWIATQAAEINVTPGGQVGSIGVIAAHTDMSQYDPEAKATTIVTSSRYKGEFAPEAPLSEEARGELQLKVNHYHAMFVDAVARGRRGTAAKVERDFGQGRMVTAKDAVARGMADHVATLETVLRRLGAGDSAAAAAAHARQVELAEARLRLTNAGAES